MRDNNNIIISVSPSPCFGEGVPIPQVSHPRSGPALSTAGQALSRWYIRVNIRGASWPNMGGTFLVNMPGTFLVNISGAFLVNIGGTFTSGS